MSWLGRRGFSFQASRRCGRSSCGIAEMHSGGVAYPSKAFRGKGERSGRRRKEKGVWLTYALRYQMPPLSGPLYSIVFFGKPQIMMVRQLKALHAPITSCLFLMPRFSIPKTLAKSFRKPNSKAPLLSFKTENHPLCQGVGNLFFRPAGRQLSITQ